MLAKRVFCIQIVTLADYYWPKLAMNQLILKKVSYASFSE